MMSSHQTTARLVSIVSAMVAACSFDTDSGSQAPPAAAAAEPAAAQVVPTPPVPSVTTPIPAPAAPTPQAQAGGDLRASRIAVPLTDVTRDHLTQALESGGWSIGSASATRSSMLAINITATKGDVTARINYYNPGGSFWERRLQRDNAAIHKDGEVLLGIVIEGNEQGAQALLQSLVAS